MDETIKAGAKVHYSPEFGAKENGIVKSVKGDTVFVVYKCNGEWSRYQDYTAAATDIGNLSLGWVEESEIK